MLLGDGCGELVRYQLPYGCFDSISSATYRVGISSWNSRWSTLGHSSRV